MTFFISIDFVLYIFHINRFCSQGKHIPNIVVSKTMNNEFTFFLLLSSGIYILKSHACYFIYNSQYLIQRLYVQVQLSDSKPIY